MSSIYDINIDYLNIEAMLEENGGEITEEIQAAITINAEEFSSKAENYCKFIANLKAEAESNKAEAERIAAKAKRKQKLAESLNESLLNAMLVRGVKKENYGTFTLSIRETTKVVVDADVETIPDEYKRVKTTIEPNKVAIGDALKNGKTIEGCYLQKNNSLTIK